MQEIKCPHWKFRLSGIKGKAIKFCQIVSSTSCSGFFILLTGFMVSQNFKMSIKFLKGLSNWICGTSSYQIVKKYFKVPSNKLGGGGGPEDSI